jgi:hypothetical protein
MPEKIVRARLDDESRMALRLMVRMGMTESEAVRTALVEAATARSTDEALRAECERLMADPEQAAHTMRIRHEMDELLPPWPE